MSARTTARRSTSRCVEPTAVFESTDPLLLAPPAPVYRHGSFPRGRRWEGYCPGDDVRGNGHNSSEARHPPSARCRPFDQGAPGRCGGRGAEDRRVQHGPCRGLLLSGGCASSPTSASSSWTAFMQAGTRQRSWATIHAPAREARAAGGRWFSWQRGWLSSSIICQLLQGASGEQEENRY